MKRVSYIVILVNLILFFNSCDTGDSLEPNINLDCNGVENGLAVLDSCNTCQLAYIYNYVTHETQFINDTLNLDLELNEMLVLPNNSMNPYWNSSCEVITETVTELNASNYTVDPLSGTLSGDFVKFNFSLADTVSGDNWDVAFRGTTIIVNGGFSSNPDQPNRSANAAVYIANGTMEDITEVNEALFMQDNLSSPAIVDDFGFTSMGWCSYDMNSHVISPIPGKILVFRTHDNKYAKVEILNFYDSQMTSMYGGFYTFNYVLTGGSANF